MLEYKCVEYGKQLIMVKTSYTNKICSQYGYRSGKNIFKMWDLSRLRY
ncbi:zinc ribbon domain-containing protein [Limosilactobacillus balticus]